MLAATAAVRFAGRGGPADPAGLDHVQLAASWSRTRRRSKRSPGRNITVIPNRTMLGIIALDGRPRSHGHDLGFAGERGRQDEEGMPGLDYDRLKAFDISSTRVAFIVNPSNPVRKASLDQIKKILTGQITNWRPWVARTRRSASSLVGGGGGVTTTVESELLDGKPCDGPNIIYVRTALQARPGSSSRSRMPSGLRNLSLAKQKGLPEIVTETPVEQSLEPHHPRRADAGDEGRHRCGAGRGRKDHVNVDDGRPD